MKIIVNSKEMKYCDSNTISHFGVPSLVLMERAALSIIQQVPQSCRRVLLACGNGNNGADGIAAGRILWNRGYEVTIFLAGDPEHGTEEYSLQKQIADRLGIVSKPASEFNIREWDVVLDALFGIGLTRNLEGEYKRLAEEMSAGRGADVVAVDIPSGIHAGTGAVMGTAVRADLTVAFGYWT